MTATETPGRNTEKIRQIRRDLLQASYDAGACHLGSSLSCVGIMVELFYRMLFPGDRFIFSKSSGAATYYAILADLGYFPKEDLPRYLKNHPECSKAVPGVLHSVGSVGHGLSVAAGLAFADRSRRVFVLLSDGECQEGATLEAALFIHHHNLDNLYVIIDNNGIQACGATEDILKMTPVWKYMRDTLPHCMILETVKGEGVSFMENDYRWHYKNMTADELKQALEENA